jgi:hypothetical protein
MSAKEYREYADGCIRSARNSTLIKECREFLQTAEAWLQAADLLEAEPRRTADSAAARISGAAFHSVNDAADQDVRQEWYTDEFGNRARIIKAHD